MVFYRPDIAQGCKVICNDCFLLIVIKYDNIIGNQTYRPRLSRSCRCMKIQGRGYESAVNCVFIPPTRPKYAFVYIAFFVQFCNNNVGSDPCKTMWDVGVNPCRIHIGMM